MKYSANALIAAAKRDTPRASLEREVVASLGAATIASAIGTSFATKLWAALKHAAVTKAGIATIAFAAATGGYAAGRLQTRAEQPAPIAVAPTPTLTLTPARTLTPTPAVTSTVTSTSTSTKIVPVVATATATATAPAPPPPQPSLADEIAAIKRARSALLSKDASTAIAALDDYDRAHPNGTMTEEALALRVRADRLAGDDIGAAEALTKLETKFPESIHLAALRR